MRQITLDEVFVCCVRRFQPLVSYCKERQAYDVDYSRFHRTELVDTPLCSACELRVIQDTLAIKTGLP